MGAEDALGPTGGPVRKQGAAASSGLSSHPLRRMSNYELIVMMPDGIVVQILS